MCVFSGGEYTEAWLDYGQNSYRQEMEARGCTHTHTHMHIYTDTHTNKYYSKGSLLSSNKNFSEITDSKDRHSPE